MKNNQAGAMQKKKPYDKPQKPAKSIGKKVFANYPQPLIGNIWWLSDLSSLFFFVHPVL